MSRFVHPESGVVFSVDDSKDDRYVSQGYKAPEPQRKPAPAKPAPSK